MKNVVLKVIAAALSINVNLIAAAETDKTKDEGKKAIPITIGYFDAARVSCNWAGHCRDDLKYPEGEYMKFLDDSKSAIESAASAEVLQKSLYDYRIGLQARETLYGRCPGRCLSYDFPVDLRNSARLTAKNSRCDLLIDLNSIYYGGDILLKGKDLTKPISDELYRQTARYR